MEHANTDHGHDPIPFIDVGGSGWPTVFLHANGYPPACYKPLLERLAAHSRTIAMLLRPLWPNTRPEGMRDWSIFSDDLLRFLDHGRFSPVIAMGHSVGAIAILRAAMRNPHRFRALVLLEPVLLPRRIMLQWRLARVLGLGYWLHPLIRGAKRRQRLFDNLDEVFDRYRRRRIFRYFTDANLRLFIAGMTRPVAGNGYVLAYSPEWEVQVYYTGIWNDWDLWAGIAGLRVPTLMVRGADSDTFRAETARSVRASNAAIKTVTLDKSTHLVPLERPDAVFEATAAFLREVHEVPE